MQLPRACSSLPLTSEDAPTVVCYLQGYIVRQQACVCAGCCYVQVADIVAKQRRIERQDKPTVEGVSFEHSAACKHAKRAVRKQQAGPMWRMAALLADIHANRFQQDVKIMACTATCSYIDRYACEHALVVQQRHCSGAGHLAHACLLLHPRRACRFFSRVLPVSIGIQHQAWRHPLRYRYAGVGAQRAIAATAMLYVVCLPSNLCASSSATWLFACNSHTLSCRLLHGPFSAWPHAWE